MHTLTRMSWRCKRQPRSCSSADLRWTFLSRESFERADHGSTAPRSVLQHSCPFVFLDKGHIYSIPTIPRGPRTGTVRSTGLLEGEQAGKVRCWDWPSVVAPLEGRSSVVTAHASTRSYDDCTTDRSDTVIRLSQAARNILALSTVKSGTTRADPVHESLLELTGNWHTSAQMKSLHSQVA